MPIKKAEKQTLGSSLKSLEEIVKWFDAQEEVDVEAGLEKVKSGVALIKASKQRLRELENEFEEVKGELAGDDKYHEYYHF